MVSRVSLSQRCCRKSTQCITGNAQKTIRPLQFDYLSYELRRQEMSHFGIKEKLKNVVFFVLINFFLESAD